MVAIILGGEGLALANESLLIDINVRNFSNFQAKLDHCHVPIAIDAIGIPIQASEINLKLVVVVR